MQNFTDKVYKVVTNRYVYHSFFWLILFLGLNLTDGRGLSFIALANEFANLIFYGLLVYLNLLYLIPSFLRTKNYFNDNWARFYTGCALEALAYLHARGVVYRDLKPENLVLSPNGYAKLCDFGFAKKIGRHGDRTYTFCGTPEYVAPEIILNKGHDFTADLWALGIFIYELATGIPPFNYNDNMETYRAALRGVAQQGWGKNNSQQNSENRDLVSKGTKEIILALAREQPYERLGAGRGGFNDIRRHKWFRSFDFNGLIMRTLQPPFVPKLENQFDTSLFDPFGEDDEVPEDEMSGWDLDF